MNMQRGFTLIEIALGVVVVAAITGVVWYAIAANQRHPEPINLVQGDSTNAQDGASLEQYRINTQAKADVARAASAIADYVNNNAGSYPSSTDQVAAILGDNSAIKQPFVSPITGKAYVTGMVDAVGEGMLGVMTGVCAENGTRIDTPTSSRQYVVATQLKSAGLYCAQI